LGTNRDQILESDRLRVRFRFCEDRYAHEVWVNAGGNWIAVLASVEGTPLEDWPASPPLQSLHFERLGTRGQTALLVGMAGKNHWSASIELDPASSHARFDVACRLRAPIARLLASTYRAAPGVTMSEARDGSIAFNASSALLQVSTDDPAVARVERVAGGGRIVVDSDIDGDSPRTLRWRYTLRAIGPPSTAER
jgi:hypothetical protein